MSKKILIVIIALAGLISFGGTFGLALLNRSGAGPQQAEAAGFVQATDTTARRGSYQTPPPQANSRRAYDSADAGQAQAEFGTGAGSIIQIKEKRLNNLISELREKTKEYDGKLQQMEAKQQRLRRTHELVRNDLEQLNKMRIELSSIVGRLKNEQEKLSKSRIEIAESEQVNLASIAATYDRMDPVSASKILTNMTKTKGADGHSGIDDVVKILYHMSERTKAKLLAQMVETEPKLTALLCRQLKKVVGSE